jgi:hypothetical protein
VISPAAVSKLMLARENRNLASGGEHSQDDSINDFLRYGRGNRW